MGSAGQCSGAVTIQIITVLLGTIMGSQHVVLPGTSAEVDITPDMRLSQSRGYKEISSWTLQLVQASALDFKYGYHQQISAELHFLHSHSR